MAGRWNGEKLAERRKPRTQHDLASALRRRGRGTTQTQISRWEAGQEPRPYIRADLAAVLGCKVDDLYDDEEPDELDLAATLQQLARDTAAQGELIQRVIERVGS